MALLRISQTILHSDPNRTDPNRTNPNRTDPNRTDPNRTDPNRTNSIIRICKLTNLVEELKH